MGASVELPPVLHVSLILLVAMVSGMAWATIPGVLKVTRGVSEVIATIMLNFTDAMKKIDKAAKNRVIHPNAAARLKSRLAKKIASGR